MHNREELPQDHSNIGYKHINMHNFVIIIHHECRKEIEKGIVRLTRKTIEWG